MRKGQIKLLEKAEKEGFTEEQLAVLRGNQMLYTLDYYYFLLKRGVSASVINAIIKAGEGWGMHSFGFQLMECGYSLEDILTYIEKSKKLLLNHNYFYEEIMTGKSKNETDVSLRKSYAETLIQIPELLSCHDQYITRAVEFAINSRISVKDFIEEFFPKEEDSWKVFRNGNYKDSQYTALLSFWRNHIPHLSDLLLPNDNSLFYEQKEVALEDQMKLFMEAWKALNHVTGKEHFIKIKDCPMYYRSIDINKSAVNIDLASSSYTNINNGEFHFDAPEVSMKLVIFHSGGYYYKGFKDRLFPLSLKKLSSIWNDYGNLGKQVVAFILGHAMEKLNAPVMKDILRTFEKDNFMLLPIRLIDCRDSYNYNHLLQKRWVAADKINWSRTDVNLAYLVIKSLPYLGREIDKKRLLQTKDASLLDVVDSSFWKRRWNNKCISTFLGCFIADDISDVPEDGGLNKVRTTADDYIKMAHEMHQKVKLGFRSWKKLKDAHDKISKKYKNRLHRVHVPKNSKFNHLRELLPESYEWIRTGSRLRMEGIEMGHCVNSYWQYINQDTCAIYSFTAGEKRYTAEFRVGSNGKYTVRQIQSKYDRGCPASVRKQVGKLIS